MVATRNPVSMAEALKSYPVGDGLDLPDFLRRTRRQPFPGGL